MGRALGLRLRLGLGFTVKLQPKMSKL